MLFVDTPLNFDEQNRWLMQSVTQKIIFIGVNSSYSHTMLSYGYVRGWNEPLCPGSQWDYLETTNNDDELSFALRIVDAAPEVLLGTVYLFNQDFLLRVLARVKALLPAVRIYLGGPQFLGDNEKFLRHYPVVNGVFRGDESTVYHILNGSIAAAGFCCLLADGRYADGGIAEFDGSLDQLPSPYLAGYFVPGKPFYQVETSRGCGGNCTFCTSSRHRQVRVFSLERIRAELQVLEAAGVHEIRIVDRTFNERIDRATALLSMFRDEFPAMRFHLEINPARVSDEILGLLKTSPAGSLHLEAGVQTFNDTCLKAVRRPANAAKTIAGLRKLLSCGNFAVHVDLIAGLPKQTCSDIVADITRLIELGPEEIQLENLKILPGTPLAENPLCGMAWNPAPPYEILRTEDLSSDELQRARHLSKIIDCYYNTADLRNLFSWAWLALPEFAATFPVYLAEHNDPLIKPSPQKRLELLADYAEMNGNRRLAELVRFVWLFNGMSAEKYGITVHKTVRGDVRDTGVIFNRADDVPLKRYFVAEFDFDVAAILTSAAPQFKENSHCYVFYLVHGQRLGRLVAV